MTEWIVLIPLGLTVAFTTLPIVTTIVLLLNADTPAPGWRFTISYAVALAATVALMTVTLGAISLPRFDDRSLLGGVEVVAGVLLVALGIFQFVRARTGPPKPSKLIARLRTIRPGVTIALGASFAVHPENLLLSAAAAARIRHADPEILIGMALVIWFALLGVSTVAAVTLAYTGARTRIRPVLEGFRRWLERDTAIVMAVIVVLVGIFVFLLGAGILGWPFGIHI